MLFYKVLIVYEYVKTFLLISYLLIVHIKRLEHFTIVQLYIQATRAISTNLYIIQYTNVLQKLSQIENYL